MLLSIDEVGRNTDTKVGIIVGSILPTVLVTLILLSIITIACCLVVHCRRKRIQSNENAYEFTSNTAYHANCRPWNAHVAMGDKSSSAIYDYIRNSTEPAGSRMQQPHSAEEIPSNSSFTVEKDVVYDH